MNHLRKSAFFFLVIISTMIISSCDGDDEPSSTEINPEHQWIYGNLHNTSWILSSTTHIYNVTNYNRWGKSIISFSGTPYSESHPNFYRFYISGFGGYGYYYVNKDGRLDCLNTYYVNSPACGIDASEAGAFGNVFGSMIDVEVSFPTATAMKLVDSYGETWTFYKTTYQNVDGGTTGSGGGPSQEKPDVSFYDFTATKNSLTVSYYIYSGTVNSASLSYGTATPNNKTSASVSGKYIKATITGLKPGTSYYVRCTINYPGGSYSTETTKCITNY